MKKMIFALGISASLYLCSCGNQPAPCPSTFDYTTASFVTYSTGETKPVIPRENYVVSLVDTFPKGTDIICEAIDPNLDSYVWALDIDYGQPSSYVPDSVVSINENKISIKYNDIEKYLNAGNDYTLHVCVRGKRQARLCKPCDNGQDVCCKSIVFF